MLYKEMKIDIIKLKSRPTLSKGPSKKARLHGLQIWTEVRVYVSMDGAKVFARASNSVCIIMGR